jgi:diguanylate cyclase (GGDEF)-like protein
MLDVDHFKSVNDTYGHLAGDIVLKNLAAMIRSNLREIDIPCRFGGEEFVVTLPETTLQNAAKLAERLRKLIGETRIETENGLVSITISIGVAEFGGECQNVEKLLDCADTALYQAKALGRNKVMQYVGR